jgi:hypothetical protein
MKTKNLGPDNPAGRAVLIALCVAALAGCGSNNSSSAQGQSPSPGASVAAASVAATSEAPASTDLPVYPGASKDDTSKSHAKLSNVMCGRTISVVGSYESSADAKTIAGWYKDHMSGASVFDTSTDVGGGSGSTGFEIMAPGGAAAAIVTQMHYGGGTMSAAAKQIGLDKTEIGFETFDPPFSQDYIALMAQATGSDAAAKQAATAKLQAMCPNG